MTEPTMADTLSRVPNDVKHRFGTICFSSYGKYKGPALILSPFSTCLAPGTQPVRDTIVKRVRDKWFTMFHNVSNTSCVLHHVFYYYTVLFHTSW